MSYYAALGQLAGGGLSYAGASQTKGAMNRAGAQQYRDMNTYLGQRQAASEDLTRQYGQLGQQRTGALKDLIGSYTAAQPQTDPAYGARLQSAVSQQRASVPVTGQSYLYDSGAGAASVGSEQAYTAARQGKLSDLLMQSHASQQLGMTQQGQLNQFSLHDLMLGNESRNLGQRAGLADANLQYQNALTTNANQVRMRNASHRGDELTSYGALLGAGSQAAGAYEAGQNEQQQYQQQLPQDPYYGGGGYSNSPYPSNRPMGPSQY